MALKCMALKGKGVAGRGSEPQRHCDELTRNAWIGEGEDTRRIATERNRNAMLCNGEMGTATSGNGNDEQ